MEGDGPLHGGSAGTRGGANTQRLSGTIKRVTRVRTPRIRVKRPRLKRGYRANQQLWTEAGDWQTAAGQRRLPVTRGQASAPSVTGTRRGGWRVSPSPEGGHRSNSPAEGGHRYLGCPPASTLPAPAETRSPARGPGRDLPAAAGVPGAVRGTAERAHPPPASPRAAGAEAGARSPDPPPSTSRGRRPLGRQALR